MDQQDPITILVMLGIGAWIFHMWLDDLRAALDGTPRAGAFPGAFPCSRGLILFGVAGALVLVGVETAGEYALGVSSEQSDITVLFLGAMVAAAFVEELIFRGYLQISHKGRGILWASVIVFSLVFALLHPFFWSFEGTEDAAWYELWRGEWTLDFGAKPWFSTAIVFLNSLWFYYLRFTARNARQSLIPCMAAHLASNLAVFFIKLAQGHVTSLW